MSKIRIHVVLLIFTSILSKNVKKSDGCKQKFVKTKLFVCVEQRVQRYIFFLKHT